MRTLHSECTLLFSNYQKYDKPFQFPWTTDYMSIWSRHISQSSNNPIVINYLTICLINLEKWRSKPGLTFSPTKKNFLKNLFFFSHHIISCSTYTIQLNSLITKQKFPTYAPWNTHFSSWIHPMRPNPFISTEDTVFNLLLVQKNQNAVFCVIW